MAEENNTQANNKDSLKKNPNIQALRGFLMIWIILFHYTYRIHELYPNITVPYTFENGGLVGVLIFFMISGYYFAPQILQSPKLSPQKILKNIANKYWRLWLPYIFSIIIIFAVISLYQLPGRSITIAQFLINAIFLYHPNVPYVDAAHWFIADLIVVQCILLLTLLFKINLRKKIIYILEMCFIVLLFVHYITDSTILSKLIFHLHTNSTLEILIGFNLYDFLTNHKKNKTYVNLTEIILLCTIIGYYTITIHHFLVPLYIVLTIVTIKYDHQIKILSPLYNLGGISFEWYLIHQNIGYIIILTICTYYADVYLGIITAICTSIILAIVLKYIVHFLPKKICQQQ